MRQSWQDQFSESPDVLKSTEHQQTLIPILDFEIGGDDFITMAGPCSVETEFQLVATAHHVRRGGARILRGGAFKPRSSPYAFQGHGLEGLKMLARARQESGLAIVTEVMSELDVPMVAEYADILQIGTRNMENYALLEAAARSGRPVLLKRGMMATIADLLRMALRYEGWEVETALTGSSAVTTAKTFRPDAVVLDVMLPDFDGLEVLRRLRGHLPDVPVLFLTARDAVEDRVAGLTAGGDDYVTKPFSLEEVVARLRALMRRAGAHQESGRSLLTVGDLTLDEDAHEVVRAGEEISLTATEFELLRFLMRNPRRVLSKAQILDRVWNYDFGGQANVVELYISYLRKKIDAGREPMIHTMRGAGYVLKPAG